MDENNKNNKGLIILIIMLSLMILGLGGWIVYDKFFANKSGGLTKESSEPLNETFKTDESCINYDKQDIYYKYIKEVSIDKSIKQDYKLKTSIYCHDEDCTTSKDGSSTFRVIVNNGILTVYNNHNEKNEKKINDTKKLSLKGVKGVDVEFSVEGMEGSYYVLVLDENNDLYLFDSYNFEEFDYGKKLIFQNVKNFAFDYDIKGVFAEPVVEVKKIAINTIDGKSYLMNIFRDKTIDLSNIDYAFIEMYDDPYEVIYVSSSSKNTYEQYNGKDLVVKTIFLKDLTINIITEDDEQLYYKLDDCEHKYRLYTKVKVDHFEYNDSSNKITITYKDNNKKEFDFDSKIDSKELMK